MEVFPYSGEPLRRRGGENDCPVWCFEGGQEREAGVDEVFAFGGHHLATPDDVRAEAGEYPVVAVRDLEHGEPPEPPAPVAFFDGLLQAGVGEGGETEADAGET